MLRMSAHAPVVRTFPAWLCTMMVGSGTSQPERKLEAVTTPWGTAPENSAAGPAQARKVAKTQKQNLSLVLFRNPSKFISIKFTEKAQAFPHSTYIIICLQMDRGSSC